ncbi:hypothetical protein ASG47_09095 [Devosia sp. Leaf420]|nr:hypothetical protein ASG47_09095 [Devosia sp. Leaf420]
MAWGLLNLCRSILTKIPASFPQKRDLYCQTLDSRFRGNDAADGKAKASDSPERIGPDKKINACTQPHPSTPTARSLPYQGEARKGMQ